MALFQNGLVRELRGEIENLRLENKIVHKLYTLTDQIALEYSHHINELTKQRDAALAQLSAMKLLYSKQGGDLEQLEAILDKFLS